MKVTPSESLLVVMCVAVLGFAASACEAPPGGTPTRLVVSSTEQRVRIFSNDTLFADFPISSGKNGSTPKGTFAVRSKSPRRRRCTIRRCPCGT